MLKKVLPAIQAVMKQDTLPAIRALRPQLEISDCLLGAMAAERTVTNAAEALKATQTLQWRSDKTTYIITTQ